MCTNQSNKNEKEKASCKLIFLCFLNWLVGTNWRWWPYRLARFWWSPPKKICRIWRVCTLYHFSFLFLSSFLISILYFEFSVILIYPFRGSQPAVITSTTLEVVVPSSLVPVIYGEDGECLKQIRKVQSMIW